MPQEVLSKVQVALAAGLNLGFQFSICSDFLIQVLCIDITLHSSFGSRKTSPSFPVISAAEAVWPGAPKRLCFVHIEGVPDSHWRNQAE